MKERDSKMKWFPFWTDKWIFGSMRIECTIIERAIWIDLLALASKDNGFIRANEETPYLITQLAGMLVIKEDQLRNAINKFIRIGKLGKEENGVLFIVKWNKYQLSERHKRRIKEEINKEMSGKSDIASARIGRNKNINNNDINNNDNDTEEGKNLAPTERKILNELKKVKNYPYDFIDTLEYIRELTVDFPGIDILDEIQKKVAWWRDNPLTKKSNPHLQLRNWLKNAVRFNNERRRIDRVGGQSDNDKIRANYEKQKAAGMFDDLDKEEY